MNLIIFFIILFSHLIAARPFFSNLRNGQMPNTVHFATISLILYYDLGLAIQAFGFGDNYEDFIPFFNAKESILIQAFILLILAPWLFHLGAIITNKESQLNFPDYFAIIRRDRKTIFYLATTVISLILAISGAKQLAMSNSVWAVRADIGEALGPLIIILALPMHFLGFYVRTSDAKTKTGLLFSLGLVLASILSTFAIGQRTNILLPILILVLFRNKITLKKIVIFLSIAVIIASALLPVFKWQYSSSDSGIGELVAETINGDFSRSSVLTTTLEMAEPIGTKILPYPMAGYVYCLLFYVPRSIVPFKGWSTSQYFTSDVARTPVEDTSWQLGIGAIEELLLNVGFWWCIPGLLVYGMCMGALDRLSMRVPSLLIPTRLAAIWLCGYDLSTLLLIFGTMAILGWVFHHLFVQKSIYISKRSKPSCIPFIKSH